MTSIWKKDTNINKRDELQEDLNVDTVVVGGGMAGILTAYFLHKKGVDVIVVEAKTIASGQTRNTTAKITSQHDLFYHNLIKKTGIKRAKMYAQSNEYAIDMFKRLIRDENISCHYEECPAYLYTTDDASILKLKKEEAATKKTGILAEYVDGKMIEELPFKVAGALRYDNQAQFNPLEFIRHLSEKLVIYENTKVLKVKGHIVYTDRGKITAKNIVFATHYPIVNVPGLYFLRQHQERSYVLALDKVKKLKGMYYSIDENGLSLRSYGDVLLLGGGGHRTGKTKCKSNKCENKIIGYSYLRHMAKQYYGNKNEVATWSAQDCMPHDEIPFIGKYSIIRPYWYVATGFKKWGMTSSMIASCIISNYIVSEPNWMAKVFSPQRLLVRASIKNFIIDVYESVLGLTKGLLGGKRCRCSHMGCILSWNNEENSWDCSCHGSRYDRDGHLKDNPAQIDVSTL